MGRFRFGLGFDVGVGVGIGGFGGGLFGDGLCGCGERKREMIFFAGFGEKLREIVSSGVQGVGRRRRISRGGELFEQRGELEFGEESARGSAVDGLRAHGVEVGCDGHCSVNGDELFGEQDVVAVVGERLAVGLALDGVGRCDGGVHGGFDRAELLDKFDGALVADAGRAGDVVDGVAAEGHDIDDALRWDAECLLDADWIEDEIVLRWVEDGDALVDELHHVLVGRDDEDMMAERGELTGERADDIVGLVALVVEDGDPKGFERAADVRLLLDEVGRRFSAVGFVAGVLGGFELLRLDVELFDVLELLREGVAVDGRADVVDSCEVLGIEVLAQLVEHVDEHIGGRGGNAGARGHGARALHGVIGAEDEGHGVEQVDGRFGGGCWLGFVLGSTRHDDLMVRPGRVARRMGQRGRMTAQSFGIFRPR